MLLTTTLSSQALRLADGGGSKGSGRLSLTSSYVCGSLAGLRSHPGLLEDAVSHAHWPWHPPELPVRPCPLPETVELMKMATLLDAGAGRGPA